MNASVDKRLDRKLMSNLSFIRASFGNSQDLVIKEMNNDNGLQAALVYMDGLTDSTVIHHVILDYFMSEEQTASRKSGNRLLYLKNAVLAVGETVTISEWDPLFYQLLSGWAVLLLADSPDAICVAAEGWKDRNVSEPTSQVVVRGPMEAFTENIATNRALIRRKIKDPQLWTEGMEIGKITKTSVSIMYLRNVADEKIVEEVRKRLGEINIDGILESGYIEELIQDTALTPFATIYNTERPDTIAAGLLEGRVAILVDGTPFVLLVPALFIQFFQSAEDYYQRADISTLLRILRFIAFMITLLAPSLYIAITTFHQEMLPTSLLINLAAQREGVPFPAFIEALAMELTFEILREAGVRMPKTVGQAVSIVGTLVIGQAAVDAGIVSAAMVIIVSITAISSFVIPATSMSISVRMIRFVLMGLAASFGLFGILLGYILLVLHLNSLQSFGIPYMQSFSPFIWSNQKDTLFRLPWTKMRTRAVATAEKNLVRQRPRNKQKI